MKPVIESQLIRDGTAMLVLAACLGFAYNSASPLRLDLSASKAVSGSTGRYTNQVIHAAPLDLPLAVADPSLHNETITATVVAGTTADVTDGLPRKLPVAMPWKEVKPLLATGEVVLVDGRDSVFYEAGHIPGSVSLPFKRINERIAEFTARYPRTQPLVVYCESLQCPISHTLAVMLSEQFGYKDVREMPGGYTEWLVAESKGAAPRE